MTESACSPPADGEQPLAQGHTDLPRRRQLVQASWLRALLEGWPVEQAPVGDWSVFEVGEGPWSPELAPTIPGAAWLDVQRFEGGPMWNKVADDVLLARLAMLGIRCDTTVVLAGRKLVANARMAHLLLYAGVRDVRWLDGGTNAWAQAALPLSTNAPRVLPPVPGFGLDRPACPQFLKDTAQVRTLLHRPEVTLASIRTWGEFMGQTSGYDYIAAVGEIAGARWGHAGSDGDVNDMGAFHTAAGLMLSAAEITALWRSQGIEAHRHTVFYCGTGWRASLAFYYAWLMGWEEISVYDGGWMEWSLDPANPAIDRQQAGRALAAPGAPEQGCVGANG